MNLISSTPGLGLTVAKLFFWLFLFFIVLQHPRESSRAGAGRLVRCHKRCGGGFCAWGPSELGSRWGLRAPWHKSRKLHQI